MEITMYHIWQKQMNNDPTWAAANGTDVTTVPIYVPLFTTQDHDYAKFVTNNSDGRYVYTSTIGYYAAN